MSQAIFPGTPMIVGLGAQGSSVPCNTCYFNTNINGNATNVPSVDTYIPESAIEVTTLNVGSASRWSSCISKTAAGIATPQFNIRSGTSASTTDAALWNIVLATAQTAVVDTAWCEIVLTIGVPPGVGGSNNIHMSFYLIHNLAATGSSTQQVQVQQSTSTRTFTSMPVFFGVSCNPGSAGVWSFVTSLALGMNLG